ncbi:MAG: DUF1501 domain-containing protein [Gemmataceae bacterium]|nr:DUF1501 domain-containing protein [Gemmataceae bacterium]
MLTFWGAKRPFCDKINRRDFLQLGALGGLSLPNLLRLQAAAGETKKHRAIIMICLAGGPSHIDMYDLKPGAPDSVRGEFKPIQTKVPGFDICEHMPLQALIADKLALVRTVQFVEPMQHELEEVYTGFVKSAKRPSFGSVISRYHGGHPKVPHYVCLDYAGDSTAYESPQYLGAAHRAFSPSGSEGVRNLSLPRGMTTQRLHDRKGLASQLDTLRRDMDQANEFTAIDTYTARAIDMITSQQAREAFDLSKEPDKVRQRYGNKDDKFAYVGKQLDSPWPSEQFLLARRLVEAGVSVVTMRAGSWDQHGNVIQAGGGTNIWYNLRTALPLLDRSIHALVTDLHERGLEKEVMVLVWGEFGRTPRISQGGRDHWPDLGYALFAGGGLKTGQVVGESDSQAARPKNRPLHAQNVLGTIYHHFGINPKQTVNDFSGRPQYLLEDGDPISELV